MTEMTKGQALQKRWLGRLSDAEYTEWLDKAEKVEKRYRDERGTNNSQTKKMNVLWSNTETLKPALYNSTPSPVAMRKFKDKNPAAKQASEIIERSLESSIQDYPFDDTMRDVVEDLLLPGRGVARIIYKPYFGSEVLNEDDQYDDEGNEREGFEPEYPVEYEEVRCTYYHYRDFRHSKARKWDEVTWVAFGNHMTRKAVKSRFGKDAAMSISFGGDKKDGMELPEDTACVWEVWDKVSGKVLWIAKGAEEPLEVSDPPLTLTGFFPCPRPIYAVTTNSTLEPIPLYCMYQDQAAEIDELTQRISMLNEALKVAGVYDGSFAELQRLLDEGSENQMIGVDGWAMFAEKGGMKGCVDWFPVEQVANVVIRLYEARERTKQELYEITGLSDIIRGYASGPVKTATEQRIKGQFAALRLEDMQAEVARFASDLMKLKAEVMAEQFSEETLQMITGIQPSPDAMALMRSDVLRNFSIRVGTESTVKPDEQAEQQSRLEFLNAAATTMERLLPMGVQAPELAPLIGEMLMFAVRGFKSGRELEDSFEAVIEALQQKAQQPPAPPPPDPRVIALQQKAQKEQADLAMKSRDQQLKEAEFQRDNVEKLREDARAQEAHDMEMIRQADELMRADADQIAIVDSYIP